MASPPTAMGGTISVWNPAVGEGCGSLKIEYYVCVGVSGDMIPSTTAKKTTTTSDGGRVTVVPGDGCYDVAADHGISLTNFYSWNPSVRDDCSELKFDSYACVGI
ncbi:LysM domain-containing protein [Penicillium chrysogenum]|uniref:LysM domain-containing protein n=1 Tax=Penicillium chrysogenum TaxID=5076 RepID=A0A167PPN7_PENCH|nr:LysM domain-containing protein [Penicillium chrysogenum]